MLQKERYFSLIAIALLLSTVMAFTQKKGTPYCASQFPNDSCAVITDKTEIPNNDHWHAYYKYAGWNGFTADCLSNRCDFLTFLYHEN